MHRGFALLIALCSLSALPGASPSVASRQPGALGGSTVVAVTSRGVRLSLSLDGRAYPFDALVLTTVRLTNLTGHAIRTWDCLSASLGAEVPRPDGTGVFYPPLLPPPGAPWGGCPVPPAMSVMRHPVSIKAGATLTRLTYVVLRGFHVRGWALLELRPGQMKPARVRTPIIVIRRSTLAGPAIRLQTGRWPVARIAAVSGGEPVVYSEFASCRDAAHAAHPLRAEATFSRWTRAPGPVLRPFTKPCSALTEWVLFVGQPGRPIARAYYCVQHDLCVYAPPTRQERAIAACKVDVARAVMGGHLPRSAARYAIGLSAELPGGLTPVQQTLARSFHERCARLLSRRKP